MDNSNLENIHIYLKSDKDKELLKSTNPYEKYIIITNETLQNENRELRLENSKLLNTIESLENDSDKNEASIRYMKGFLKNIVIMESLSSKKNQNFKKMNDIYNDSILNYKKITLKHYNYLQIILLSIVGIIYQTQFLNTIQLTFLICLSVVFSAFHESTIREIDKELNLNSFIENIKKYDEELVELKKGQDFLVDYIDIM